MSSTRIGSLTLIITLALVPSALQAQGPAGSGFTYQGQLSEAGTPLTDTADFVFTLWNDSLSVDPGDQVGPDLDATNISVVEGLFTVVLDFGSDPFAGEARWLQIAVRSPAGGGTYTTLAPRQELTPAPYALYALDGPGLTLPFSGSASVAGPIFDVTNTDDVDGEGIKSSAAWYSAYAFTPNTRGEGSTSESGPLEGLSYGLLVENLNAWDQAWVEPDPGEPHAAAFGLVAACRATNGPTTGILGQSDSKYGMGLFGYATSTEGHTVGVYGKSLSPSGVGGSFRARSIAMFGASVDENGAPAPFSGLAVLARGRSRLEYPVGIGAEPDNDQIAPDELRLGAVADNEDVSIVFMEGELDTQSPFFSLHYAGNDNLLHIRNEHTGPDNIMTFTLDGNVGIGTESPASPLTVDGRIESLAGGFRFPDGTLQSTAAVSSGMGGSGTTGYLPKFADASTLADSVVFESNGNIGIGTASPETMLDVASPPSGAALTVGRTSGFASIAARSDASGGWLIADSSGDGNVALNHYDDGDVILADGGGNVGIGINPPTERLEVAGSIRASHSSPNLYLYDTNAGGSKPSITFANNDLLVFQGDDTAEEVFAFFSSFSAVRTNDAAVRIHGRTSGDWNTFLELTHDGSDGSITTDVGDLVLAPTGGTVQVPGSLAIATSAPVGMLSIHNAGSGDGISMLTMSENDTAAFSFEGWFSGTGSAGNELRLRTLWEPDVMTWRGNGNVGIGTGTPEARLDVKGNIIVRSATDGSMVLELGEGLDYAEGFDVSDVAEATPGTVLIIDPENPGQLMVSSQAYDTKVAGIVAGGRGLGSGVRLGASQFDHDVALAGRVYCNVDAAYGAIQAGDLLTTSPTPGHAMKVSDSDRAQGAILGKAMQTLDAGERGQILVLVTLQ